MAWPSGSIITDNVDQGIDRPRIARHEIRQSHVDADAITDEFGSVDTTGVADGNVLGYDGTKWFPSNNLINNSANYAATLLGADSFDFTQDTFTADPTVTVSKNADFAQKNIQIANCARTCMRRAECLPAYMATCPCCGVCNFIRSGRNMRARNESPS